MLISKPASRAARLHPIVRIVKMIVTSFVAARVGDRGKYYDTVEDAIRHARGIKGHVVKVVDDIHRTGFETGSQKRISSEVVWKS